MPFHRQNAAQIGRQGGRSTFARHGRDHMRAIGSKGFAVTTERHFGGSRRKHLNELIRRGLRALDPCPWNGRWQNYEAFPDAPQKEPTNP
jgi:general stress protein YciG